MPINRFSSAGAAEVLLIIFIAAAVVGGAALYFTVFSRKNEDKYTGFMKWLYDFVHFRILTIASAAELFYVISAIAVTLTSFLYFSFGAIGLLLCPLQIVFGNILLRITYEFLMTMIIVAKNTGEINSKIKNQNGETGSSPFEVRLPEITVPRKAASKFCPACGKPLNADAKFCDGCGKKFE